MADMQNPTTRRGIQLAALRGVVKMKIDTGMTFRGVPSPIRSAQALGYDGPRSLAKVLAWVEAEQKITAEQFEKEQAERLLGV